MESLAFARLGLGLLGVLAAVQGVVAFPRLASTGTLVVREHGMSVGIVAVILPFLFVWILSYYLVFHNLTLARLLSPPNQASVRAEAPLLLQVLVGLAGMLILAYSLPGVTMSVGLILTQGSLMLGREFLNVTVAHIAQAGLGLALVLRPHVFLQLWSRRDAEGGA